MQAGRIRSAILAQSKTDQPNSFYAGSSTALIAARILAYISCGKERMLCCVRP